MDAELRSRINGYGWFVGAALPPPGQLGIDYMFTVGLTQLTPSHPELIITGVEPVVGAQALGELAGQVRYARHTFHPGQTVNDIPWIVRAVLLDATSALPSLRHVNPAGYPADQQRLLQVVWPDPDTDLFPWQPGYPLPAGRQPLYGQP